jgi:hypothetical protein
MEVKVEEQSVGDEMGAGLEHNGCAAVLSRLGSDTAGQQIAREEKKEGITGQALTRARDVIARWKMDCTLVIVIRYWGRNVSRARSLARRQKKTEAKEMARQEGADDDMLPLPIYDYKTGAMGVRRLREQVHELISEVLPLARLEWVEEMIVQVGFVRAVIRGFAAGARWESAKRAVLQLVFNWDAEVLVYESSWSRC